MARTMKRIVITCIMLILIAAGACALVMNGSCSGKSNDFLSEAKVGAVNTLMDVADVRGSLESELRSHVGELSQASGIPEALIDDAIDSLAIKDWKAVVKPEGVTELDSYSVDANGVPVEIVVYDDSSILTVGAYGQDVTFQIPESAQSYEMLVPMLEYLPKGE